MLSDKLSPIEVTAAQSRLYSLLEHLDGLEQNNRIITPAEWNARNETGKLHNANNSYLGRDAENAIELKLERSGNTMPLMASASFSRPRAATWS